MASNTEELIENAEGIAFVPVQLNPLLLHGQQYDIQDNGGIIPQYIVVREIDFAPEGSLFPFVFKDPDRSHAWDPQTFQNIITYLLDGTYKPNGKVNQYYRPLDVKLSARTRYIFCLNSRWNWRFSTTQDGATIGESLATIQQRYANLRHFIAAGNGQDTQYGHDEFCRIICFDAVPELDAQQNVVPFHHRFNLVVEFVYPDGDGTEKINVVPIVIDPDVRYPGGSGQ